LQPDEAALLDAVRAAGLSMEFLGDATLGDLRADLKTQSAVLHQLMVLGEAIKRISLEFRAAHPDVAWKKAAGMRDVLIHAYDEVDLAAVHETVRRDIPELLAQLSAISPKPRIVD
jgi:uncharacterized protein with HEPN domain